MELVLWLLGIHLFEVIIFFGYRLITKNKKLYKVIEEQQRWIDSISIIIKNSHDELERLDVKGHFKSDDEVGYFFKGLTDIQQILDRFTDIKQ